MLNQINLIVKSLISSLILIQIAFSQSYNPDLLSFTISLEKDTFLLDEPIYVELKETNIGDSDALTSVLNIEVREYHEIELLSAGNNRFKQGGSRGHLIAERTMNGILLKPDESQYFVFHLNWYFGEPDNRSGAYHYRYLPAGKYHLKLTHFTNANYPHELYLKRLKLTPGQPFPHASEYDNKMPVTSNEIVFWVVKPNVQQEIERLAYTKAVRGYRLNKRNPDLAHNYLQEFLDNYPESIYRTNVINKYYFLYWKPTLRDKLTLSYEQMIEETKDKYYSYIIRKAGMELYDDLKSDKRWFTPEIELYNRLMKKYPGTKLAKYSEAEKRNKTRSLERILSEGKSE